MLGIAPVNVGEWKVNGRGLTNISSWKRRDSVRLLAERFSRELVVPTSSTSPTAYSTASSSIATRRESVEVAAVEDSL